MSRFAPILAATALAACAGETITQRRDYGGLTVETVQAATGGVQRVEVRGAPPDGADAEAVVEALRAPARWPATRYAPTTQPVGTRLVLEFGRGSGGRESCRGPSGSPSEAPLRVAATLCRGDRAQSTAALVADAAGPSDPRFAPAMTRLLRAVLTPTRSRFPRRLGGAED